MWVTLASIFMLFAGLVAAYAFAISRQGLWRPVRIPPQMWAGTLALAMSSLFLEFSRRNLRCGKLAVYCKQLYATVGLGTVFLLCQALAWINLAVQGVFLKGNPHGSMWFAFTGFHAAHVAGGIIALALLTMDAGKLREEHGEPPLRKHRSFARVTAMYWHFMGVLWAALLGLLHMWNQL